MLTTQTTHESPDGSHNRLDLDTRYKSYDNILLKQTSKNIRIWSLINVLCLVDLHNKVFLKCNCESHIVIYLANLIEKSEIGTILDE